MAATKPIPRDCAESLTPLTCPGTVVCHADIGWKCPARPSRPAVGILNYLACCKELGFSPIAVLECLVVGPVPRAGLPGRCSLSSLVCRASTTAFVKANGGSAGLQTNRCLGEGTHSGQPIFQGCTEAILL